MCLGKKFPSLFQERGLFRLVVCFLCWCSAVSDFGVEFHHSISGSPFRKGGEE